MLFQLARDVRDKVKNEKAAAGCLSHIKETFLKSAPSDDKTKESVVELQLAGPEAKYVLGRLANHMQSKTKEVKINESNIEHIFPQNPDEKDWPNKKDLVQYLWHIGNLTILGKRLNRAAANKDFATKRTEHYLKSEVTMTTMLAKRFTDWNQDTIRIRAEALAPLIIEVWNFDNPSRV